MERYTIKLHVYTNLREYKVDELGKILVNEARRYLGDDDLIRVAKLTRGESKPDKVLNREWRRQAEHEHLMREMRRREFRQPESVTSDDR